MNDPILENYLKQLSPYSPGRINMTNSEAAAIIKSTILQMNTVTPYPRGSGKILGLDLRKIALMKAVEVLERS